MQSFTKNNLLIAACYAGTLVLGMILGPKFSKENADTTNGTFLPFAGARSAKVEKVLRLIDEKYVDSVSIDTLQNLAIQDVLERLDPHSTYLPPIEAQYLDEDLEGHFNGIGIEYYIVNDTLLVTSVLKNSPAKMAGLKPGDKILRIGNKEVAGKGIRPNEVVELIRGKRGSSVELLVKQAGSEGNKVFSVKRDRIEVSSVDVAYMLNDKTGYIKISKFGARTDADFTDNLLRLRKSGMQSLVLDLRENGGGYLNSATKLTDEFLPEKKLIVYTQGLHEPRTDYYASAKGDFEKGKLVVLIDEKTASASEIVAGAIQDLDRGIIVGRQSFGKGLVQEQFNFGDGSVLNLTVARYYTPSGRSIQRSYKNGIEAYYHEAYERQGKESELKTGPKPVDSSSNKTYKTATGRVMYGGGGIMPDVYVPADTSGRTDFYYTVSAKGLLESFLFNHLLTTPKLSEKDYLDKFELAPQQYKTFVSIAAGKGIKSNSRQIELSKPLIEKELKALLARYYYGDEMFYKVLNTSDRDIARSLDVLR